MRGEEKGILGERAMTGRMAGTDRGVKGYTGIVFNSQSSFKYYRSALLQRKTCRHRALVTQPLSEGTGTPA